MEEMVGRVGYEAYAKSTGGKTWDGKPMPSWDGLTDPIRAAWNAAAKAVLEEAGDITLDGGTGWTTAPLAVGEFRLVGTTIDEQGRERGLVLTSEEGFVAGAGPALERDALYRVSFERPLEQSSLPPDGKAADGSPTWQGERHPPPASEKQA